MVYVTQRDAASRRRMFYRVEIRRNRAPPYARPPLPDDTPSSPPQGPRQQSPHRRNRSNPDVLAPQLRPRFDERAHQFDAFIILDDVDMHTVRSQIILGAHKILVLSGDHARNLVQHDRPAAHGTW